MNFTNFFNFWGEIRGVWSRGYNFQKNFFVLPRELTEFGKFWRFSGTFLVFFLDFGTKTVGSEKMKKAAKNRSAETRKIRAAQIVAAAKARGETVPESVANVRFSDSLSPKAREHARSLMEKMRKIHAR